MDNQYYRVLNPFEEPSGQILTTGKQSQFRQEVFAYRRLSHDIYIFAKKTGLRIINAVRIAENIPAFLDELNVFFQSNEKRYDLQQMLISDPLEYISGDDLYAFASNYIADVNETNLFYDWGKDNYLWEFIWEMVRNYEYPNMPSRMDSLFLFDNLQDAKNFMDEFRDSNYVIATVKIIEGYVKSFDMNWFSNVPSDIPLSEVEKYARNYWEQKQTDKPITEVLFQGKYIWKE